MTGRFLLMNQKCGGKEAACVSVALRIIFIKNSHSSRFTVLGYAIQCRSPYNVGTVLYSTPVRPMMYIVSQSKIIEIFEGGE